MEKQILILGQVPAEYDTCLLIETFLRGGHCAFELIAHCKKDLQEGEMVVHQAFDSKGSLNLKRLGK